MSRPEDRARVGLIGAGSWARACHLQVLRSRADEVELVAVHDPDQQRARRIADEFGFESVCDSVDALVGLGLDACIVASPAYAHFDQAHRALLAGSHVLLEKPVTLHAADAWQLAHDAEASTRELIIAFGWNYSPVFEQTRDLLNEVGIGRLEHVALHMGSATRNLLSGSSVDSTGLDNDHALTETWTDRQISGGGYGNAQLSHALGVLFGLIDDGAARVVAVGRRAPATGMELSLAIAAELRSGATLSASGVSYETSLNGPRQQLELRLFGSEGQVLVDFGRDKLQLARSDGTSVRAPLPPGAGQYDGHGPAGVLVDIALGRSYENASDAVVGARTVEVLEAAYRQILPEMAE